MLPKRLFLGLPYIVKSPFLNKLIKGSGGQSLSVKNSRSRGWVEEVAIVEVKVEGEPNSSIRRTFICIYSGVLT